MADVKRFKKKFDPLGIEFDGTNAKQVEGFTWGTAKKGGFRLLPEPVEDGENGGAPFVAEVYDYVHSTWITVKTGMSIMRGPKDEHYPIDAQVLIDSYDEIPV